MISRDKLSAWRQRQVGLLGFFVAVKARVFLGLDATSEEA